MVLVLVIVMIVALLVIVSVFIVDELVASDCWGVAVFVDVVSNGAR